MAEPQSGSESGLDPVSVLMVEVLAGLPEPGAVRGGAQVVGLLESLALGERWSRLARAIQTTSLAGLAQVGRGEAGPGKGFMASEVSVSMRWSAREAEKRLTEADTLARRFPETLAALGTAEVSCEQTQALVKGTENVDDEVARRVQGRVLPLMPAQMLSQTRAEINRAVLVADPDGGERRHARAKARRRVEPVGLPEPGAVRGGAQVVG